MKLSLENIGMIKNADVDLNGITVICGDNNTGKSTIGKALFCVFNSCYDIDNNIIRQMVYNLIIDINNEISKVRNLADVLTKIYKNNIIYLYQEKTILIN